MARTGLFIVGTDTGVGKTLITGGLCAAMRARRHDVGVWKPVQSGCVPGDAGSDSAVLRDLSGVDDAEDVICPFSFAAPVTPELAAHLAGRPLEFGEVLEGGEAVCSRHDIVLAEGAGGWYAPLAEGREMADLVAALGWPVLIVARAGLGTINHTLLTYEAINAMGLTVVGVILNGHSAELPDDTIRDIEHVPREARFADPQLTNAMLIHRAAKLNILGIVPLLPDPTDIAAARAAVAHHVDVDGILDALG
jgi:dethiobiotin synthetase